MEHLSYLFAAYSLIFIALFLYVLFISRRQAGLEAEVKALEARLESLGHHAGAPDTSADH